jgi:hypothetical protein
MKIASLLPPTRYCRLPRPWAGAVLCGLLLLIAAGLVFGVARDRGVAAGPTHSDIALYQRIIDDVAGGESYYSAVAREHRSGEHIYPLKPVFAVRPPLLAWGLAALPDPAARVLALRILTLMVLIAWCWRLERDYAVRLPDAARGSEFAFQAGKLTFIAAGALLLLLGLLPGLLEQGVLMHEVWAGEMIALALALYDPRRWWISLAIGLLAACLRELAAPFLLAMGAAALIEGRKREAVAWGLALAVFAAFILVHAHLLAPYLLPTDQSSPGWIRFGGWPFVLLNAKWHALLVTAPDGLVIVTVPLMLLGALCWPGGRGLRLGLICAGYNAAFLVAGRTVNSYWGLMVTPLMALALVMTPGSLVDLVQRLKDNAPRQP